MESKSFEGIKIILEPEFEFKITPKMAEIDLDKYDIKYLLFKYEHNFCGCCEGNHEKVEIKPSDLFDFVEGGGLKEIDSLKTKIKKLNEDKDKLKAEIKQFKSVLRKVEVKE